MRGLGVCILLASLLGTASSATAQRSNPGASGNDPCMAEADRLYSSMRNLDERMRLKREHVAKCRAASRGGARR